MPKDPRIKKVLVIGSGPIIIGQAAEFDYAGTQACLALKEEGYEVVLVNSNPATIQTDVQIADKVYMEPLTLEYVAKIVRYERPDAIVPGLGGQTGLNLAVQLAKKGVLQECQVEILGTSFQSIEQAEDRELFKKVVEEAGVYWERLDDYEEEGLEELERRTGKRRKKRTKQIKRDNRRSHKRRRRDAVARDDAQCAFPLPGASGADREEHQGV